MVIPACETVSKIFLTIDHSKKGISIRDISKKTNLDHQLIDVCIGILSKEKKIMGFTNPFEHGQIRFVSAKTEWYENALQQITKNPADFEMCKVLSEYYFIREAYEECIVCWEMINEILGEKIKNIQSERNKKDLAYSYIFKARLERKYHNVDDIEIKKLYQKASKLFTEIYEDRKKLDLKVDPYSVYKMIYYIPIYHLIVKDLEWHFGGVDSHRNCKKLLKYLLEESTTKT